MPDIVLRGRAHRIVFGACLLTAASFLCAGRLNAEGYDGEDFSLRFPAALSRFSGYGDVAGVGGASAGSMWSSSINPASLAWRPSTPPLGLSLSPQWAHIGFLEGTDLDVYSEAATWQTSRGWVFQPALAQVRSNTEDTRQGLDYEFRMDYAQLQCGRKVGDDLAFGAGLNFAHSGTTFDFGPMEVSESRDETYGVRMGVLARPVEKLLAGLVFDYSFTRSRMSLRDIFGLGIGDTRVRDTSHQFSVRPGVSYEYRRDSAVYVDYQWMTVFNGTGHLDANRFYMGVDHRVVDGFFVRGGPTVDTKGNVSWSCGFGIYPTDWLSFDVAYQNNMFPELAPEFGRSRTVVFSVSVSF